MNILAAAFPILGLIIYLSYQNWERAVKIALVLVILEGVLRKWVLPQATQLIYFLKDFVLLGAYLRYFSSRNLSRFTIRQDIVHVLLILIFLWCLPQIWNPSLGSPIIGFLGFKNYFFYVPLIGILPSLFCSVEELYRFIRTYLFILIPVGLLAIAQFFAPPDSPLNVYAWGDSGPDVVLGGNNQSVRVTGSFSYITGYTTYLTLCLALLMPLLSINQIPFWQWVTIAEFLLIAITSFMTGARGLISTSLLFFIGYFIIEGIGNLAGVYQNLKKLVIPVLMSIVIIQWRFQSAIDSFWVRVTSNNDMSSRITDTFIEPFINFKFKEFDGYGIGSTFQANEIIRKLLSLPQGELIPVYYEGEPGRIALEIGPIGFLLWYGLRIVFLIVQWNIHCKLKCPLLRRLALSIFLIQLLNMANQTVFNHVANLYYWFLNGLMFLLLDLDRIDDRKEQIL
jgi:hypothetical protein